MTRSAPTAPVRNALPDEGRWLIEILLALAIATAAVFLAARYIAIPWTVLGRSMEPTLEPGDRVLVDLRSYRARAPAPGEIALFEGPDRTPLVKRVVAGPEPSDGPPPWSLDPGDPISRRFWVRGDNARESADSRVFGGVPAGRFRGRVIFRYWPVSRMGWVR